MRPIILFPFCLFLLVSCGGGTSGDGSGGGGATQTITVDDFTFSPTELDATAGETIDVVNNDSVAHTVTSESAENAFDDSGDFDTGTLSAGASGSITLPADATVGETLFFYCEIHKGGMTTPNGTITVVAP